MKNKSFTLLALIVLLFGCKKSDNSYHLHYEEDGCEYDYYIDDFDGLDYETVERYAAFDIADDRRSIVTLMDSLIDAGTNLRSWWSRYYHAMKETLPPDSILPRLLKLHDREPSNILFYGAIGDTYCSLGDTLKGLEYYHQGLDKAPRSSDLWYGFGLLKLQQGDTLSAVNSLTKAVELAQKQNLESWAIRIQLKIDSIASGIPAATDSISDTHINN